MRPRIQVITGDITRLVVEGIANAANQRLMGGGGVDGAIHRATGPALVQECAAIRRARGGCAVGEAVITGGGCLGVRHIIHTVGPVWRGGGQDEAALLRSAYDNSLRLAAEYRLARLAFPNISTGVYDFPKPATARIAINAVRAFLAHNNWPQQVIFVCFDAENVRLYQTALA
ncbi:MAG: O-acetyl-ADP-ribose deacetylase [Sodalis sp. (in: enterobacteria)]|uniref:O-acetyl-ADP-ribose deacetylase n=1 Tax=Sodalis sp. (in: enterobacteria) TaxID=1898979 RepID=UPI0039E48AD6